MSAKLKFQLTIKARRVQIIQQRQDSTDSVQDHVRTLVCPRQLCDKRASKIENRTNVSNVPA